VSETLTCNIDSRGTDVTAAQGIGVEAATPAQAPVGLCFIDSTRRLRFCFPNERADPGIGWIADDHVNMLTQDFKGMNPNACALGGRNDRRFQSRHIRGGDGPMPAPCVPGNVGVKPSGLV